MSSTHIGTYQPALDGYRAIAVLAVMGYHTYEPMFSLGWVGVSLFFVLSGYLITGILVDSRTSPNYFRTFYARRILRIFPAYYALLLLALAYGFVLHAPLGDAPWFFAYLQNILLYKTYWQADFPWPWNHTWSLAVEEQFYLVAPVLVRLFELRRARSVFLGMVIFSLAFKFFVFWHDDPQANLYPHTLANLDLLAAGCWLACSMRLDNADVLRRRVWRAALLATVGYALVIVLVPGMRAPGSVNGLLGYDWLACHTWMVLTVPFVLFSIVNRTSPLCDRFLSSAPLTFTGRISYGLYLYHFVVFSLSDQFFFPMRWDIGPWMLPFKFVATFVMAYASWRLLEEPVLRLKRHFQYAPPTA